MGNIKESENILLHEEVTVLTEVTDFAGSKSDGTPVRVPKSLVGAAEALKETTYSELKALRDASALEAGMRYRITDYQCTTITAGTTSAGHQFDIIVLATSASTISEDAKAILHEGDTYFASCDLDAWELKYCLDNDTTRFDWADSTNGKGVVWYMKDEFLNELPYDFKNIQYYRSYDSKTGLFSTINSSATGVACYTFSNELSSTSAESEDMSLSAANKVYDNVMKWCILSSGKQTLNSTCFFGQECYKNTFVSCYKSTFGNGCRYNTFASCSRSTFGNDCYYNTFVNCFDSTFGNDCYYNTVVACESTTFGNDCSYNKVGYCRETTFGNDCSYNTVGNDCDIISFGNRCSNNTLGSGCMEMSFGNNCEYNMVGDLCNDSIFASYCCHNTVGNYCDGITLDKSYTYYCKIESGTKYVTLTTSGTTSDRARLQHVEIYPDKSGDEDEGEPIEITVPSSYLGTTSTLRYGTIIDNPE